MMNITEDDEEVGTSAGVAKIVTEDEDELSLCQDGDDDTEIAITDETRLQSGMAISHGNKYILNTASASKVGQFRPFLGEVKKLKGPLMSIFLFEYRNVEVQLLRQHWMHFVRDHSTCWMLQMRRYKSGLCR